MCLHRITGRRSIERGFGWKIFRRGVSHKEVYGLHYDPQGVYKERSTNYPYRVGVWCLAHQKLILNGRYLSGFHIYKYHPKYLFCSFNQKEYVIRRVAFKDAYIQGTELGLEVIVARKMKILKETDDDSLPL